MLQNSPEYNATLPQAAPGTYWWGGRIYTGNATNNPYQAQQTPAVTQATPANPYSASPQPSGSARPNTAYPFQGLQMNPWLAQMLMQRGGMFAQMPGQTPSPFNFGYGQNWVNPMNVSVNNLGFGGR